MIEKIGKPAVCYETELDEAFLLGTRDELSRFAHAILKLLDMPSESIDYLGISTQSPLNQVSLTQTMSQVEIDRALIVENENDRKILMNKTLLNNGDTPID